MVKEKLTEEEAEEIERRVGEIWDLLIYRRIRDGRVYDKDVIERARELATRLKEIGIA
jgi:hypothetical protein